jgi:hypothetical protein
MRLLERRPVVQPQPKIRGFFPFIFDTGPMIRWKGFAEWAAILLLFIGVIFIGFFVLELLTIVGVFYR